MSEHIVKSNQIPSGIYKHVHSGDRLQVQWQPSRPPKPYVTPTAYHKIGEGVVIVVNIIGWMAIAFVVFIGLLDIVAYQFNQLPDEEVKIEQAE